MIDTPNPNPLFEQVFQSMTMMVVRQSDLLVRRFSIAAANLRLNVGDIILGWA